MIHHSENQLDLAWHCEVYHRLVFVEKKMSGNQAAKHLGKSPSFFSGANSGYARYRRLGLKAFKP